MSEIIRLTESDLVTLVKKVINEQTNISNDWMTNMKNSGSNKTACPVGFIQMTQKEISAYDKQLVKPWASTTDGSGDYKVINATTICRRTQLRNDPNKKLKFAELKLKTLSLDEIVSGFRDVISGIGGTIAQIIIAGLGGHVVNMIAWGLLVAYDIYSWVSKGTADWFNLLHDLFWLLLSGAGGKIMGALKPLIKGESKLLNIFVKLSKTKSWTYIESIISKISSYGGKIVSKISQSLKYLISKLPSLKTILNPLMGVLNRVGGTLKMIEDTFSQFTKLSVKKGTKEFIKGDLQGRALNSTIGQLK